MSRFGHVQKHGEGEIKGGGDPGAKQQGIAAHLVSILGAEKLGERLQGSWVPCSLSIAVPLRLALAPTELTERRSNLLDGELGHSWLTESQVQHLQQPWKLSGVF